MDLEKLEARIDRIELKLVELQIKLDHLLDLHEKLLELGLKMDPQELEQLKIRVAQVALDLRTRQN